MPLTIVFGGTFDPIHEGHIFLVRSVQKLSQCDRFLLVPTFQNPHKTDSPIASATHRLAMVNLAVGELTDPSIEILDWEIKSPSFTVETLEKLSQKTSDELALVMGDEGFSSFPKWKAPKRILELAHLIVVRRQGLNVLDILGALEPLGLHPKRVSPTRVLLAGGLRWVESYDIGALPYSATHLRREMGLWWEQDEKPPMQGIQRGVWRYIKENRLYAVKGMREA